MKKRFEAAKLDLEFSAIAMLAKKAVELQIAKWLKSKHIRFSFKTFDIRLKNLKTPQK